MVRMRNFQDTFETRKQKFVSAFSSCMNVPLKNNVEKIEKVYKISNQ